MSWLTHLRARRWLAAHFHGASTPSSERKLRRHLGRCGECRALYTALCLAHDGGQQGADERHRRMEAALFPQVRGAARSQVQRLVPWAVAAVAGAVLMALAFPHLTSYRLSPRGTITQVPSRYVSVSAYQHQDGTRYRPVTGSISHRGALAFTYTNNSRQRFDHLLLFGVDEHYNVYWFYPAWTDPARNPTAYPVGMGTDRRLPEEVIHDYQGRLLRVFALFTRQRGISVREVERLVRGMKRDSVDVSELDTFPLPGAGLHTFLLRLEDR